MLVEPPLQSEVITEGNVLVPNEAVAVKLYDEWKKGEELKKRSVKTNFCSCVIYSKALVGLTQIIGLARNWPKNSLVPVVGGVVITNESYAGHVGVITSIDGDNFTITEANYNRCQKSTRTLNINNPVILGYWKG